MTINHAKRLFCLLALSLMNASVIFAEDGGHELFQMINAERAAAGSPVLVYEESAASAARRYAEEIVKNNRFSHTGRDGRRAIDRYRDAGGSAIRAGEVIGKGVLEETIINAWRVSPAHFELLLQERWNSGGAGTFQTEDGGIVAVVVLTERYYRSIEAQFRDGRVTVSGFIDSKLINQGRRPAVEVNGELFSDLFSVPSDLASEAGPRNDHLRFTVTLAGNYSIVRILCGFLSSRGPVFTESFVREE
jgi:hypothetical protein